MTKLTPLLQCGICLLATQNVHGRHTIIIKLKCDFFTFKAQFIIVLVVIEGVEW